MKRKLGFIFTSIMLISLGVVVVIVSNTNPKENILAQITFFLFLFIVILSLGILLPLTYRATKRQIVSNANFKTILRRSGLIATALIGILVFSALHVLNLLSAFTFIFSLILVELFFVARKIEKRNEA